MQSLDVAPEQVLQLESQRVNTPPTILYPFSALVQDTDPLTVTEQAAHPVGHWTAYPVGETAALTVGELRG